MVAGSFYTAFQDSVSPLGFALLIKGGSSVAAFSIAFLTLFARHIFHQGMLKKLTAFGSLILIGYGLWFFGKAIVEAKVLAGV